MIVRGSCGGGGRGKKGRREQKALNTARQVEKYFQFDK